MEFFWIVLDTVHRELWFKTRSLAVLVTVIEPTFLNLVKVYNNVIIYHGTFNPPHSKALAERLIVLANFRSDSVGGNIMRSL